MKRLATAAAGVVLALCLAGVLTSCAGAPMTESTTPGTPFRAATPGALTAPPPTADAGEGPADVAPARWTAIVDDLAKRGVSGIPTLVSAEPVTWPDGALGCPAPGQSYTQAVIEGLRVVVTADGKDYDYRFGKTDAPKLCEQLLPGALRRGLDADRTL